MAASLKVINCLLLLATVAMLVYNSRVAARRKPFEVPRSSQESVQEKSYDDKRRQVTGGAIYTRWGHRDCPGNGAELVYSGVMGGQYFAHHGGGSNYLCLPLDPTWATYSDAVNNRAIIYGAEYEFKSGSPFGGPIGKTNDHDATCAVCRLTTRASAFMLPGRNKCHPGWTLEYWGYLATAHYGHVGRTEYVCVDHYPQADRGGHVNHNGALLYPVEGKCGSLPCPPYVNGRELTCAVCSI